MNIKLVLMVPFVCNWLVGCNQIEHTQDSMSKIKYSFSFDPGSTAASHREAILLGDGEVRLADQKEFYYCVETIAPEKSEEFFAFVEGIRLKNSLLASADSEEWVSFMVRDEIGNEIFGYLDGIACEQGAKLGIGRQEYYVLNSIVLKAIGADRCEVVNDVLEETIARARQLN